MNLGTAASTGDVNNRGPSTASVIVAPAGGATLHVEPAVLGARSPGPNTPKGNGDAFMTRTCNSGNSGCTGTTNNEFNPLGYFYIVRVAPAAVGVPMTLQIYDPAFVQVGDACTDGPSGKLHQQRLEPLRPARRPDPLRRGQRQLVLQR